MTLHDHIDAVGSSLGQLDGMPAAEVRAAADQLAVLSDLLAGVADGRDEAVDMILRIDGWRRR
jgi:hypothetical protein